MNLIQLLPLTVRVRDFNLVAHQPELLKQLRKLTLHERSGLNHALDQLLLLEQRRDVQAKVLLAYRGLTLVGWALMTKESSEYRFVSTNNYFDSSQGVLVELFVHPKHRRQGIGSRLFKVAKKQAGKERLCVAPWEAVSKSFFRSFAHYRPKVL